MPLPDKTALATKENVQRLHEELSALLSGHPGVLDPCSFYVHLDQYLGPWGSKGYPIGYGLYYCRLFGRDKDLQSDQTCAEWVRKTMVRLQELLRDFVVDQFRKGRLGQVTATELRNFAFESHSEAYQQGGLRRVVETSPLHVPGLFLLAGKEFDPRSENFAATVKQAVITGLGVGYDWVGERLVGSLTEGEGDALQRHYLPQYLDRLVKVIHSGRADHIELLERIVQFVRSRSYPTPKLRQQAEGVIDAARRRIAALVLTYRGMERDAKGAAPEILSLLRRLCNVGERACAAPTEELSARIRDLSTVPANGANLRSQGSAGLFE